MFPRWLTWMFIGVMLYMIYASSQMSPVPAPVAPVTAPEAAPVEKSREALAETLDVERWRRAINPDYAAKMNCSIDKPKTAGALAIKIIQDVAGEGADAACGETITIQLTVWNANGGKAFEDRLPLALGSRELASGLDAGLPGIKPGGVRTLILPPQALVRNKVEKPHAEALKALPKDKLTIVTVKRIK